MKNRGEILEKAIDLAKKRGITVQEIADYMGVNRATIYNWEKTTDLPFETLLKIGKFIRHDFREDFEASFEKEEMKIVAEGMEGYGKKEDFKEKYYSLLQEQNQLLQNRLANFNALAEAIKALAENCSHASGDLKSAIKKNGEDISKSLSQISAALSKS